MHQITMSILLFCIAIQVLLAAEVSTAERTSVLGQGFFLAGADLFGEFSQGASIFQSIPRACLQVVDKPETKQVSTYFKTSSSFYEYVSTTVGLKASMKGEYTMGTTLSITSKSISGTSLQTSGISLDIYALRDAIVLSQDCINSQPLSTTFLSDFEALPVQIRNPNNKADWLPYDSFLKKYGSHFAKEANNGSRLQQWVFASRSEMYSQNDFNVRGCVDLSDNTGALKLDVCGNYSKGEKERVLKLTMSSYLQIKGGTATTRAQLRKERTAELIEKFLVEAQTAPGNVLYVWMAIWDLLKQRSFGVTGDHLARTMNLEAYYKGLLDFGCTKVSQNNVVLRWFNRSGSLRQPEYSCLIAPEGCRDGNRDCHLGGAGSACYCYGPSCVASEKVNDPNSKIKEERVIQTSQRGSYTSGINLSCKYHFIAHCNCDRGWGGNPTQIWPSRSESESRSLLWALHNKAMKQKGSSNGTGSGYRGSIYHVYVLMFLAVMFLLN